VKKDVENQHRARGVAAGCDMARLQRLDVVRFYVDAYDNSKQPG